MVSLADVEVITPKSLEEALEVLEEKGGGVRVLAGGTDLIVQMKNRLIPKSTLLNIYGLNELRYIRMENGLVKIGALTDFAAIANSDVIKRYAPLLAEASLSIGPVQILNKATLGGNIMNGSPAADSLPPLYVLEANLTVRSRKSERTIPIRDFFKGYKKLDIRPDELLVEVSFKPLQPSYHGAFFKHGLRQGSSIAVVNGAVLISWNSTSGEVSDARVALGAVAPTVVRAEKCEALLVGSRLDEESIWTAAKAVLDSISPIDDVRGSAAYRREMCINYVFMTLWMLARRLRHDGE